MQSTLVQQRQLAQAAHLALLLHLLLALLQELQQVQQLEVATGQPCALEQSYALPGSARSTFSL